MSTNSNDKIENILNSLSGIEKASTKPYFFTRLEARMKAKKNVWEKVSYFLSQPVVALAGVCFILMVNAFVIFSDASTTDNSPKTEIASIMDEYNQLGTNLIEFENIKP